MPRVVVLNAKGGCGKTTLATSLGACAASRGRPVRLLDLDPLGAALAWARRRPAHRPPIRVVPADRVPLGVTRSFLLGAGDPEEFVIFDTPAGLERSAIALLVRDATAILRPVLPSAIDIGVAPKVVADVLLAGAAPGSVAVVANRIRARTLAYAGLTRFLDSLAIPVVAVLHESQSYVRAAAEGVGIHEIDTAAAREERRRWIPLLDWLAGRGVDLRDDEAVRAASALDDGPSTASPESSYSEGPHSGAPFKP
jgi:chromosome partitioning protein